MKIVKKILIIIGALIVLLFINNNYFKKIEPVIKADGAGYYDYLPSIFILKDFNRKNIAIHKDSIQYNRVLTNNFHVSYLNHKVNKYPIGTALLQSPFFFTSYFLAHIKYDSPTGFEMIFQKGILYAAIFYLIIGLYFLFKLLSLYKVSKILSIVSILFCLFGTNILYYTLIESSFSHVYSFTLITIFLFVVKSYIASFKQKYFYLAFFFLGLIILTRQINILILFFIPFLFNSFDHFSRTLKIIISKQKLDLLLGLTILLSVFSIQFIAWYFQTGSWVLYSYQNEHFNFLKPELLNLLVSYKKGLFIYTPITLIIIFSLIIYYLNARDNYHLFTWLIPFLMISYVFSSWWSWFYGCSLGLRIYIDFYAIFFIPFGIILQNSIKYIKLTFLTLALFTIPYSLILTYQYKHFIIHWINMDKEMFWFTFLKHNNNYKGLVWLNKSTYNYPVTKIINLKPVQILAKQKKLLFTDTIKNPSTLKFIKVKLQNHQSFDDQNESVFVITISRMNETKNQLYHQFYLYHFIDYLNPQNKNGVYVLNVENTLKPDQCIFQLEFASDQNNNKLEDISIEYY